MFSEPWSSTTMASGRSKFFPLSVTIFFDPLECRSTIIIIYELPKGLNSKCLPPPPPVRLKIRQLNSGQALSRQPAKASWPCDTWSGPLLLPREILVSFTYRCGAVVDVSGVSPHCLPTGGGGPAAPRAEAKTSLSCSDAGRVTATELCARPRVCLTKDKKVERGGKKINNDKIKTQQLQQLIDIVDIRLICSRPRGRRGGSFGFNT